MYIKIITDNFDLYGNVYIINNYYKDMALISKNQEESIKLDLYDKKLIFHLSQNFRISEKALAKKLQISPQRVHYKIERLKKEILDPNAFLNFPLLKIPSYIIYTPQLSDETVEKLINSKEIYFFMQTLGKYQGVINVVTEDIERFCKEMLGEYHIEVIPIIKSIPDDYNPFHLNIKPLPSRKDKSLALDTKDYKILSHLGEKPLDPLLEIQNKTKIDSQTIKKRINKLWDANIIQKFRYGINIFKIGFLIYTLRIKTAPSKKEELLNHLRANDYSGFVFETYEGFTMHFLPPSHVELFKFTKALEKADKGVKVEVVQNTEVFTVDLVPKSAVEIFNQRSENLRRRK